MKKEMFLKSIRPVAMFAVSLCLVTTLVISALNLLEQNVTLLIVLSSITLALFVTYLITNEVIKAIFHREAQKALKQYLEEQNNDDKKR